MVPVKELDRAKSRLGSANDGERALFAQAFASDVIHACLTAPGVTGVVVVSSDTTVLASARESGADGIADLAHDGPRSIGDSLNAALTRAHAWIRQRDAAARVAIVAGDLPCATPDDVGRVLAAANKHGRCFVADHSGTGTTILTAGAGQNLQPMFGDDSAALHRESGAWELTNDAPPQLRLDVDTAADLEIAAALGLGSSSQRVLRERTPTQSA